MSKRSAPHQSELQLLFYKLSRFDSHYKVFISIGIALLTFFVLGPHLRMPLRVIITWNAYNFCALALAWITMLNATPLEVQKSAQLQDSSRTIIFLVLLMISCANLFAVAYLLGSAKTLPQLEIIRHVLHAVLTVACSFLLIHTIFALRYAHLFYADFAKGEPKDFPGGMDFPEIDEPDYLDFAYFSFTVGMTSQTSDVRVITPHLRHLVLFHSILSFGFNTAILALSINMISGLF